MIDNMHHQIDLFEDVLAVYGKSECLSNSDLYRLVGERANIDVSEWDRQEAIGQAGDLHKPLKRQMRWYQQTLKELGLLERAEGERGVWRLTLKGKSKLTPSEDGTALLGFSTNLGVAIWTNCERGFPALDQPINLMLTSLPYPLAVPRDYGNPKETEYVDWVCRIMEPIVANLAKGASLVINVGNDVFLKGSPARSLYKQRMVLALHDRFGLSLMDELIWENPTRPPGPVRWASMSRQQLNGTFEPCYWFTMDPLNVKADNRRVLQPHSQQHIDLIRRGGENRVTSYADGAHHVRQGSYANETLGKIPRNVLRIPHNCADKRELAKLAKLAGLPVHGATMPLKLAKLIIEFLTEKDDLVVDPCAGWFRTAKAAEELGRRWFATEKMGEYVLGGGLSFLKRPGFEMFGGLTGQPLPLAAT